MMISTNISQQLDRSGLVTCRDCPGRGGQASQPFSVVGGSVCAVDSAGFRRARRRGTTPRSAEPL